MEIFPKKIVKKFCLPKSIRALCLLFGGLAVFSALRLNYVYRSGVDNLPTLVDKQGNTASVDATMQALDSYEHLQKFHTLSIISLVRSFLFFGAYVLSTSERRSRKV